MPVPEFVECADVFDGFVVEQLVDVVQDEGRQLVERQQKLLRDNKD
jgi:hypothetical protein